MYNTSKLRSKDDKVFQNYFNTISQTEGIIIDLASGVSGYFGPVLDRIKETSEFVITNATKEMIKAHGITNKKNIVVCEIDLDKKLPFKNGSLIQILKLLSI